MTPEELLLRTFVDEATELVATAETALLQIEERGTDPALLNQLMGALHTLKGGSATVGLHVLCELVHDLEGILDDLRHERLGASAAVLSQLFDGLDTIRANMTAVAQGDRQEAQLEERRERLRAWRSGQSPREPAPQAQPDVGGLHLGEYDWVRIDVLRAQGKPLYRVEITSPGQPSPEALRPALRGLHRDCDVVAHALATTAQPASMIILLATTAPRSEVEATLRAGGFTVSAWGDFVVPAPAQAAPAKSRTTQPAHQVIKVDVQRVDRLMEMVGELVIVESMVKNDADIARLRSPRVRTSMRLLTRISLELQDTAMFLRMVPIRTELRKMERLVRDLARATGKKIRVALDGEATEMDRAIADRLGEPLLHLVRNAVDHGIEDAAERAAAGKPEVSVITIKAAHQGGSIVVEVGDDGRGLDRESIVAKAQALGLVEPGARLDENETFGLIFHPGFSTAKQLTELSGRGVGLDIVRRTVEAIRGRITVASRPGQGTTFRLTLPLTLAIINGTLVRCGGERYVVPTLSVIECLRPSPANLLRYANQHTVLRLRDHILPVLELRELLGIETAASLEQSLVLVVESAGRLLGLAVEDVLFQQQIVIKSLDTPVADHRLFSGAAILSDGRVGLILNVDSLATHPAYRGPRARPAAPAEATAIDEVAL